MGCQRGWVDLMLHYARALMASKSSGPLATTNNRTQIFKSGTTSTLTTNTVTTTPTGGTGSYTYLWEWVSNPDGININTPDGPTTSATKTATAPDSVYQGTIRCKVMDGVSTVYSANVDVSINRLP